MTDSIDVMISCTPQDLAPHLAEAKAVVAQYGMRALAPVCDYTDPACALDAALDRVDQAAVYLGIIAHHYGTVLDDARNPDGLSLTEIEYRRAMERGIPVLIFIMDDNYAVARDRVESGPGVEKLARFKAALKGAHEVVYFTSSTDLARQMSIALMNLCLKILPVTPESDGQAPTVDAAVPDTFTLADIGPLPAGSRLRRRPVSGTTGNRDALLGLARKLLHGAPDDGTVIASAPAVSGGTRGKTQLAAEFAYRYGRFFAGVHWIDLQGKEGDPLDAHLREEIAACGQAMKLPGFPRNNVPLQVFTTVTAWRKSRPRLVILENAKTPEVVAHAMTLLVGLRVLVIMRPAADDERDRIRVESRSQDTLTRAQSIEMLRQLAPHLRQVDDPDLDALAARLGDYPLALRLAGSYLHQMAEVGMTVAEFAERLDRERAKTERRPIGPDMNVVRSFGMSWSNVDDPLAKRLFRACGYLAPNTPLPLDLLLALARPDNVDANQPLPALQVQLGLALAQLTQYGLLAADVEYDHLLVIHPQLNDFARGLDAQVDADERQLGRVTRALVAVSSRALDTENYDDFVMIRPHVELVADSAAHAGIVDAAHLWNNLAYHLRMISDFEGARRHYERALRIFETKLPPRHAHTLATRRNLETLVDEAAGGGERLDLDFD